MAQQPLTAMRLANERGSAMMEFVLSLPFLWLIIAMCLGFGAGVLSRHRAALTIREHALASPGNASITPRDIERLRAVRLSGNYSIEATGGGMEGGGLNLLVQLLADVSNAQKLCFSGLREPNVQILPEIALETCFEADSNFWTYEETKDQRMKMIAGLLAGATIASFIGF